MEVSSTIKFYIILKQFCVDYGFREVCRKRVHYHSFMVYREEMENSNRGKDYFLGIVVQTVLEFETEHCEHGYRACDFL